eukprot:2841294-Rhodomonas_salina.2
MLGALDAEARWEHAGACSVHRREQQGGLPLSNPHPRLQPDTRNIERQSSVVMVHDPACSLQPEAADGRH